MERNPDSQVTEIDSSQAAAAYTAAYSGPISGDLIPTQYKVVAHCCRAGDTNLSATESGVSSQSDYVLFHVGGCRD